MLSRRTNKVCVKISLNVSTVWYNTGDPAELKGAVPAPFKVGNTE
jgi:hypothetical protein